MQQQPPQSNSSSISKPDMANYWMPFTANRQFKTNPRLLTQAEGMYYTDDRGQAVLDATAGLWCCNAGHGRKKISEAVSKQISHMDYAPSFQLGHPLAFELAHKLTQLSPDGLDKVFFTNSGSESVDTALKMALCYHRANGQPSRTRFIGRELGYHGVGFGGISVGGIGNNRKTFSGQLLQGVDHLPHTLDIANNAFSKGLPKNGIEKAEVLEQLITLHGAENIAAVIVEPMSGSAGVILPPDGYLKRLREITQKHGILLIFDEVITGFGRLGAAFASDFWQVTPDIITTAKAINNGAIPMGAVFVSNTIHDTCMQGPESMIEFFHGYTYSGHPVAAASALATLEIYQEEQLFERAKNLSQYFEDAVHSLKGLPNIIDIRNIGLVAGIQFAPSEKGAGKRGYEIFDHCFRNGTLVRATGDILALSPPLIVEKSQIDDMVNSLSDAILAVG
ncbi:MULTISPECIES: aspartate aminotransferase family protein [Pseudomonadati]|uniref:Aspartate aminotransferase family protein n=1 Tax=Shewanella aestuarii TaxID=1028752 RepID=A0ABT0L118_9GAMM|nr:aspartate aminotransferase family protein [Shewanella aestuarii]MCL1116941.1 aspartate aminotransferase family protein [Shewanella aestuarii]GGN78281.1 aspartate aminotransferase family protein [Shewanella aestuarii]